MRPVVEIDIIGEPGTLDSCSFAHIFEKHGG